MASQHVLLKLLPKPASIMACSTFVPALTWLRICASGGHVSGAAILGQRVHFIFLGSVLGLHSDVGSNLDSISWIRWIRIAKHRKAPQSTAMRCNLHGIRICTVAFSRESKVILMWAIIAVYWIHPTHKLIIAEKVEDSCEPQGLDAWRGVWYSATWMGA